MIAWLGMYDLAPLQGANDRFWTEIRAALGDGPDRLARGIDPWEAWCSAGLLLAQTCGLPYRTRLHDRVTLVATPDYGLPGCPAGYYNSVLVARADAAATREEDFAGRRFAYNEPLSQSGWAGPMTHFAARGVRFRVTVQTGSHAASARAVASGKADIAGIDALTWDLLREHDPVAGALREIARTAPTPALPYITAAGRDPAPLRAALRSAIDRLSPGDRAALHLRGIVEIPAGAYLAVATPPGP